MLCYFCRETITGQAEYHHPDKQNHPDWVEPACRGCHRDYHSTRGDFRRWGAQGGILAPFRGRPGYELALKKWPGFHHMGGLARSRTAQRDALGRFV